MIRPLLTLLVLSSLLLGCGNDEPPPAPPAPKNGNTPAPAAPTWDKPEDFVGRWSEKFEGMWVVIRDDGRYRYSGLPSASAPIDDPKMGGKPPWMTAHTGTWTIPDGGGLELLPDEEKNRTLLPFEFDRDEGSLNLKVIGFSPSARTWIVFFKDATEPDDG